MNYYSNEIINGIIDTSDLNDIIDNVNEFKSDVHMLFVYFAFHDINLDYIHNLLEDDKNMVAFRCIDNSAFNVRNCPSAMIYRKYVCREYHECTYYILMICTKQSFKKLGYASAMLDDFIAKIRQYKNENPGYTYKIVLSSLDGAVSYYEKYGFNIIYDVLEDHPVLAHFEIPEDDKPSYIMELII